MSQRGRLRVGFVVQRCGLEVNGGAESLCLQIAQRMGAFWTTEILTTCALDYMTWENFYPEGTETIGPTLVRRFPVDRPRDVSIFDKLSAALISRGGQATLAEQENWMRAQGPMSSALFEFLQNHQASYEIFIFFGYLYATTYFGLPLVRRKAWLEPLAHDEWTIHLRMWDSFFSSLESFVFNTEAERDFLRTRFPNHSLSGPVIGIGVEPPGEIDPRAFRHRYGLDGPFLLYAGRIDESKGCREMFDYFLRWKQAHSNPYKLVLLGNEVTPVPFDDDIVHLGFVDEQDKWAAMTGCDWLLMPSPHESLSIVLLETWSVGRPALVNARCSVLVRHCQDSHGGLWHESFAEWRAALESVDSGAKSLLGRQGQAYVRQRYSWQRVEAGYLDLVSQLK